MPPPDVNRSGVDAPNTNEDVELGFALKQNLVKCFEECVQSIRLEHKQTESCMLGLRQDMQKATGEIIAVCQQMEANNIRCQAMVDDVLKRYCGPSEHSPKVVSYGATHETLGQQRVGGGPMPASKEVDATVEDQSQDSSEEGQRQDENFHALATVHNQMLCKIESDERRREEVIKNVESYCACYHDKCVPPVLVRFVNNSYFNHLCAVITVAFAIAVGVEADLYIRAKLDGKSPPTGIQKVLSFFNLWFVAEVILRITACGIHYFLDRDWKWNLFDLAIAVLSLLDMLAGTGSFAFLRILRALKIAKALRVVRLLKEFHDLRLLISSMLTSLMSLLWSMVFLAMVIYLAAVTFVEAAADQIKDSYHKDLEGIHDYYSSLSNAMYTLFLCITGGMDWSDGASPIWGLGWFYGSAFMGYILFCLLGILNVTTSIFVERASNMKKHDRDYAVAEELRNMEEDVNAIMELFHTLTKNGNHEVDITDLQEFLKDKSVIAHFACTGIEISDRALFSQALRKFVVDGRVNVKAFVRGCLALRGFAKQSDTFAILAHVKKVEAVLDTLKEEGSRTCKALAQLAAEVPTNNDIKHMVGAGSQPAMCVL